MSDNRSPEEIQESIEETREQLAEDLDKLGEKLSPEGLKEEAASQLESLTDAAIDAVSHAASSVTDRAETLGETLTGDLKNEPLPLALLGAALGVGWLLVRSAQRDTRRRDVAPSPYIAPGTVESGVTADVRETTLLDQSGHPVYETSYDSDEGFLKQNGLLIGAGAVAAGAILGLMLPTEKMLSKSQSSSPSQSKGSGFHLKERVRVNKSADDLYAFWRDLTNLPKVMSHLETVTETENGRSHWVAKGPAGISVEWDAIITDDRPGESLAWRSDPNSQVPNEGAVGFRHIDDENTDIIVALTYHPPGGALGAAVANLFGASPQSRISDDLEKFKEKVESGALYLAPSPTSSS